MASEVMEHIPDDLAALDELTRVLRPGGTMAVTIPAWLPEKICWALSDEYHAPFVEGGHVRIYTEDELRSKMRGAGLVDGAAHHAHALHAPYWWLKCAVGPTNDDFPLVKLYNRLLVWDITKKPAVTRITEQLLNPVLGKSLVVYATKPITMAEPTDDRSRAAAPPPGDGRCRRLSSRSPRCPASCRPRSCPATVDGIADWQLPNGMIPWFPGGHADPWNHVEAAMALAIGGRRADAERAYDWLAAQQRPDGSWHQYYLEDSIEQDKLDANVIAYVAAGVWHHHLLFGDTGFIESMWPVVEAAIDFVLDLQTPRGEILWARHADGTPWSFALLTGSSSICHSLRCAIALAEHLGHERPDWELSAARLAHVIAAHAAGELPDAFAPKHRWAMDWYYPVLAGVVTGTAGRERLDSRRDTFLVDGMGVRCVSDRPWVTAAETCECLLAELSLGERDRALELFGWAQQLRSSDGHYWTGIVFPEMVHFPGNERSTYTDASIVLAADALSGASPAAVAVRRPRRPCPPSSTPTPRTSPPTPAGTSHRDRTGHGPAVMS